MSELKVLMMGGRRCGKTSALASMFDCMQHGSTTDYFTVSDQTILEIKNGETQDSLDGKISELKDMLGKANTKTFLVDAGPTNNYWYYNLQLQIPGTQKRMNMKFRDSAGEFFEAGGRHTEETNQYVSQCDVFIIIVDTPYLMGTTDESTKDICTEGINLGTNRINDIHNFLTHIDDHNGEDSKMVVFVPLKCEKWVKEGRITEVNNRIKDVYSHTIKALDRFAKMTIAIIPIETAGNIIFEEFKDAYTYKGKIGPLRKCCLISDNMIRLSNGDPKKIKEGDIVNEDDNATIAGTNLMRPYSWYRINPNDSSYAPTNCEQLPLHILKFHLGKTIDIQMSKVQSMGWFTKLWKRLTGAFGSIDPKEYQQIQGKMIQDGVINEDNGIEYIKRCY